MDEDNPLQTETVTFETIANGRLDEDFHEVLAHLVSTIPPDDQIYTGPYHPTKPRTLVVKVSLQPSQGGVQIAYSIDQKIPMAARERGGFAFVSPDGQMYQMAAKQTELPLHPGNVTRLKTNE